jgi:serine phosphatase RsbU (regulator of sigma subunit)
MDDIIIAAVADCTGHGVPGALMSMMGIAFLREIVNHQRIVKPKDILEELRKNIILALQQKGITGEQKDGMDFAIVAINKKTSVCSFAGANNSLYIIENEVKVKAKFESDPSTSTLTEIKGDRMPISIYSKMGDFTEKEIVLQNGDLLYLTSDGYADQFGGQNGKKYLSARFREKLNSVAHLDMVQQHIEMEKELMMWQGSFKQTDDITLLGIRYSG